MDGMGNVTSFSLGLMKRIFTLKERLPLKRSIGMET